MALTVFFGGTFDPVHYGHVAVARSARDTLRATIHLMPAADPPHRPAPAATALQRARMLELAVAGEHGLDVDRRELARETRSYTVDTLREVRAQLGPQAPVALLIGADSLRGLTTWKEWPALFDLAHFVVAGRLGDPMDSPLPAELRAFVARRWVDTPDALHAAPAGSVLHLGQPLQAPSASDIRARIASGRPWRHLVPAAVAEYIDLNQLYSGRPGTPAPL